MEQTIKCPNCKADLVSSASVCEWCNTIINKEGKNSIENITNELEEIIKLMKGIEIPNLFSSFNKNAKISMPIFTIAFLLLGYKINILFWLLALVFLFKSIKSIFKKKVNQELELKPLKAAFDEKVRTFENLYGVNNKYKAQIQEFRNEWLNIEKQVLKGRKMEWLSYSILVLIIGIAILLNAPKTAAENEKELYNSEYKKAGYITNLIYNHKFDLARTELLKFESQKMLVELKSKLQLEELKIKIVDIETKIKEGNFDQAQSLLSNIKWIKESKEYEDEETELQYYKVFITAKKSLNEKMPETKKIKVEEEFDF